MTFDPREPSRYISLLAACSELAAYRHRLKQVETISIGNVLIVLSDIIRYVLTYGYFETCFSSDHCRRTTECLAASFR